MTVALLNHSHGTRPEVLLDDVFPDGIVAMDLAAEARTLLVATQTGKLILLRSTGEPLATDKNFRDLSQLVWAAAGNFGAAVLRDDKVVCFDRSLRQIWEVRITGRVTALAISPHGSHLAFSTDSCRTHIVTIDKRELAQVDTHRAERLDFEAFKCANQIRHARVWITGEA